MRIGCSRAELNYCLFATKDKEAAESPAPGIFGVNLRASARERERERERGREVRAGLRLGLPFFRSYKLIVILV